MTTHVLLWSQSQCALHIETVQEMLTENAKALAEDRRMDYVPIGIGTEEECRSAAEAIRPTLRARQAQKVA